MSRVTHTIGGGAEVVSTHGEAQAGQGEAGAVTAHLGMKSD